MTCDAPSTLGIYVIKVDVVSPNNIKFYDTSCSSYIWIDMEGPRNNRKLTKGESNLQVGSGARFVIVVVCTNVLNLYSDF